MILGMKRHLFPGTLALVIAVGAFTLTGCSTTQTRISDHPEIYNSLSPSDQALVSAGKIRSGMSKNAAWLAWGSPDRKFEGSMRGRQTETWVYINYETAYPYGYPYGPSFGYGFGGVGVLRRHGHHRFFFYGSPFYDPFYYSAIPPSIPVPYKTVTFTNGRVASFQYRVERY